MLLIVATFAAIGAALLRRRPAWLALRRVPVSASRSNSRPALPRPAPAPPANLKEAAP